MSGCYFCGTRSKKRSYTGYVISQDPYREIDICNLCWDSIDDVKAALEKKRGDKVKKGEIRPCVHCGRTDFKNDHARRGHQARCPKNPNSKKPKADRPKADRSKVGKRSRRKGSK